MKSLEYHVGGQPVRVVVGGVPAPDGASQLEKAAWYSRHADRYRRSLVLPPRGHSDMSAVLLTEPSVATAHAGLLFLDAGGYPRLSMPGVIAAARAASEHGLISTTADENPSVRSLIFDTAAGVVTTRTPAGAAAADVRVESVPSFVYAAGVAVSLPGRMVPVDIAYCGEFYALVDGESAGVVLDPQRFEELRRIGQAVCAAVDRTIVLAHPADATAAEVAGVVFTGPPRAEHAHLRTVLVSAGGAVDVSPGPSAVPAVMAVLDAMGLVAGVAEVACEGLSGVIGGGRVLRRTTAGDRDGLVVEVHGQPWPTGDQSWLLDHDDPFVHGLVPPRREARSGR
jgi:proline racemase